MVLSDSMCDGEGMDRRFRYMRDDQKSTLILISFFGKYVCARQDGTLGLSAVKESKKMAATPAKNKNETTKGNDELRSSAKFFAKMSDGAKELQKHETDASNQSEDSGSEGNRHKLKESDAFYATLSNGAQTNTGNGGDAEANEELVVRLPGDAETWYMELAPSREQQHAQEAQELWKKLEQARFLFNINA